MTDFDSEVRVIAKMRAIRFFVPRIVLALTLLVIYVVAFV
jgi:hypothetical protein